MIVRLWEEGDTERMILQDGQSYMVGMLSTLDLAPIAEECEIWVGETDEGIMAIAGIIPQWEGRATAWAMISQKAGAHFMHIHREVKKHVDNCPFRRLEATVDAGFEQGHRWMGMLGFEVEGYLRAYRPDGGDQLMYARVR